MAYIKFSTVETLNSTRAIEFFRVRRQWLDKNAGNGRDDWDWGQTTTNNGWSAGVHIYDEEIALMFKLKFNV